MSDDNSLKAVYFYFVGKNNEDENIYQILLSETPEEVWAEDWGETPAGICQNLKPDEEMYQHVKEFTTDINLILAQDSTQYSMQDARDNIVALAYEDLTDCEEYPEPYRLVFYYGEDIESIEEKLKSRKIKSNFID